TDLDALAAEPGVTVTLTADPDAVLDSNIAVLPGSRATVDDLSWLRSRGLADAIRARASAGKPVLGICGGYPMLATTIIDDVESGAGQVNGLDLLPATVSFGHNKTLGTPTGHWRDQPVTAYAIHHGTVRPTGTVESFLVGCRVGATWGTTWH